MAQKTYNILNYGKEYKQAFLELLSDTTTRITLPDEIDGVQYSLGKERWDGDMNLQYIDFNKCDIIPARTCAECSNLIQAVFSTHTTQIGDQAFYNCKKFEDTELPHTLTNIGAYAFYNAGSSYSQGAHTFTMIDEVGVHTTIGDYAFYGSQLSEINAYTNNIGLYAFRGCYSLTTVNIEVHGKIDGNAFDSCPYIENFIISPNSVITQLGSSVFASVASDVPAAARNIAPFDFRNSTFTSVPADVWYSNYYDGTIYFPSTLTTISGNFLNYASGNWKLYFNSVPTVSSSSYLRSDSGTTFTVKYFFPYELMDKAASATNWSSHTSQMIGYGSGFEAGTTLPQYMRSSGVAITWYSDETLTTQITTSSSMTDVYYCTLSATRQVWFIGNIDLLDAGVTISDGIKTYNIGDPVVIGTTIIITPNYIDPTKNILYSLMINNVDYTSLGAATLTPSADVNGRIIYWDGVNLPLSMTLADNSWSAIKAASENNTVPQAWLGQTKPITINGYTVDMRLVDITGEYRRSADDSIAYCTFDAVQIYGHDMFGYNSTMSYSELINNRWQPDGNYYELLPQDLRTVLESVKVYRNKNGADSELIEWNAYILFPQEHNLTSTRTFAMTEEWNVTRQDQYYIDNPTAINKTNVSYSGSYATSYWTLTIPTGYDSSVLCKQGGTTFGTLRSQNQFASSIRFAL